MSGLVVRWSLVKWVLYAAAALILAMLLLIGGYGFARGYDVVAGFATLLKWPPAPVLRNTVLTDVPEQRVTWLGDIEDRALAESSGLAVSNRHPDILWSINDSGDGPNLYAMHTDGASAGSWPVAIERANDWEAMDSFVKDGIAYLVIGDIGDNLQWRDDVSIWVVREPEVLHTPGVPLKPEWQIRFSYPNGPRDSEALAVDPAAEKIYVLTKRDYPPQLYVLPLNPSQGHTPVMADLVSALPGMPRATDLDYEEMEDAHWRHLPTGMDLHEHLLLLTTLRHAYVYDLNMPDKLPIRVRLPSTGQREAIAFAAGKAGDAEGWLSAYVTKERYQQRGVAEVYLVEFRLP